jgi:hypothetical protein
VSDEQIIENCHSVLKCIDRVSNDHAKDDSGVAASLYIARSKWSLNDINKSISKWKRDDIQVVDYFFSPFYFLFVFILLSSKLSHISFISIVKGQF